MDDLIPDVIITGEQIKAARAMLRLDQTQFAALTHVSTHVVRRMERSHGPIVAAPGLLEAVRAALEDAGIELIDSGNYAGVGGPGIRMRGDPVEVEDVVQLEVAAEEARREARRLPDAS